MSVLKYDNVVITNSSVFDFDLTPPDIFIKPEANEVLNFFKRVVNHHCPHYTQLVGPTGTGKTTTVKHYMKVVKESEFKNQIDMVYISCKNQDTPFKCLKEVYYQLANKNHAIETSRSEAFELITQQITKKCLVVLDEIDLLRDPNQVLYRLARFNGLKDNSNPISIIAISNTRFWEKKLDPPTRSSLTGMKPISFLNYEPSQLLEILSRRSRDGLKEGCHTQEVLEYIAAKTVKERRGDARIAINTLFEAATHIEDISTPIITTDVIDEVFEWAMESLEGHMIKRLEDKYIKILYSCLQSKERLKPRCYETYEKMYGDLKKASFYNALNYLENLQLTSAIKVREKHAVFDEVAFQVNPEPIIREIELRNLNGVS